MKAVGYIKSGPIDRPDALIDFEAEKPVATGQDLLVNVHAIAVNPVDTKIRQRRQPDGATPDVLGWDAVGEVVGVGDAVTKFKQGDLVWYAGAIDRPGANSEFHLVDERIVGHAPTSISASSAAALPLTTLTASEMLFERLKVNDPVPGSGNAIVIIGGAGGVGSIAIQLVRALTDLSVIATASRDETKDWVKELGAQHVIDHREPLAPQIEALGIGTPGFVFSTNHSDAYATQAAEFLAAQGRFGLIDDPTSFDIMPFKQKSISVHWEFMYTRSMFETKDMSNQSKILNETARLIDDGKVRSTLTDTFGKITAANLIEVHTLLESGKACGKLVLEGF